MQTVAGTATFRKKTHKIVHQIIILTLSFPGCFQSSIPLSSSVAAIHANDLFKREAAWMRISGFLNPDVPNFNLPWPK